mgnify:CR=1 FL=1
MEITKCEMIDTLVAVKVNLTLDWLLIQLSMQCIAKKNRHSQRKKVVFMELLSVRFPIRVSVWVNKNVLSLAGRYGQRAGTHLNVLSAAFMLQPDPSAYLSIPNRTLIEHSRGKTTTTAPWKAAPAR